jgi:hypothetical protein
MAGPDVPAICVLCNGAKNGDARIADRFRQSAQNQTATAGLDDLRYRPKAVLKRKDPSGGTTGRVKPYGRLGWMGARAEYSRWGGDNRSHIY